MKGIKNISPETHIILMSASCLSNDFKKIIEKGEAFYITKPFDFPQIKDTMKKALEEDRNFTGTRNMVKMEGKKEKEFAKNNYEWTDIYGKKNF
jgi:DNA-binding NtrC family response regulator